MAVWRDWAAERGDGQQMNHFRSAQLPALKRRVVGWGCRGTSSRCARVAGPKMDVAVHAPTARSLEARTLVTMAADKIDGLAVARAIKAELAERVAALTLAGLRPGLGTVLVGDDPGSHSYVRGKHRDCAEVGIESLREDLPSDATAEEVAAAIDRLNANPECTGFIVQLPLPRHIDDSWALGLVDPEKDADGLHPLNLGRLVLGSPGPLPCTPRGVVELLRRYDVPLSGAHVVVVGRGTTVGRPIGLILTRKSENATVTLCHTGTKDLASLTRQGDIVVSAAGSPGLLTADHVRPGAVVIDVGITRTDSGLAGDVDASVWDVADLVAPVPGGVGPMTRAMLLANVVERAERLAGA